MSERATVNDLDAITGIGPQSSTGFDDNAYRRGLLLSKNGGVGIVAWLSEVHRKQNHVGDEVCSYSRLQSPAQIAYGQQGSKKHCRHGVERVG